ncbi:MAG: DUF1559 domain-containing protein [Pirellulales bacterium]|nr:DUF1559 domain-containing protein [Pirellulales bacterium]
MVTKSNGPVIRMREVVAVVVLLAILWAVLIPVILASREKARRSQCEDNLKALGVAFLSHEILTHRFPPSCHVMKDADGGITSMDGWSWCVDLMLSLDQGDLWLSLDMEGGAPLRPNADGSGSHAAALATPVARLRCPSFGGRPFVGDSDVEAITNYKAMGATHLESLNVASPNPTTPRYAPESDRHPDGGIYPGSTHGVRGFKTDGTARTILIVETVEQNVARWTVGNECAVVGLPPVVEFDNGEAGYDALIGYTPNKHWDESTIPPEKDKTYLEWDYDAAPYSDGGASTPSAHASGPMKYGPSSHHDGVTNHLFADGSVHPVGNGIDAALYMFLITRSNCDP